MLLQTIFPTALFALSASADLLEYDGRMPDARPCRRAKITYIHVAKDIDKPLDPEVAKASCAKLVDIVATKDKARYPHSTSKPTVVGKETGCEANNALGVPAPGVSTCKCVVHSERYNKYWDKPAEKGQPSNSNVWAEPLQWAWETQFIESDQHVTCKPKKR